MYYGRGRRRTNGGAVDSELLPSPNARLLPFRHPGGNHCVTRVFRGKARAANDQDVVDPEPGLATCCHVRGRSIPYCGGIVEVNRRWIPGGKVLRNACLLVRSWHGELWTTALLSLGLDSSIAQRETPDETKPM